MTKDEMILRIDQVADAQRRRLVGDPVRAFEYQEAERGALEFKAAGFAGPVPPVVQAWMDARGWPAQQAAEDILLEADLFRTALESIRATRLKAKYAVGAATDQDAETIYSQAIVDIKAVNA